MLGLILMLFEFNSVIVLIKIVIEFELGMLNSKVGIRLLFFFVLFEFFGLIMLCILFLLKFDLFLVVWIE